MKRDLLDEFLHKMHDLDVLCDSCNGAATLGNKCSACASTGYIPIPFRELINGV